MIDTLDPKFHYDRVIPAWNLIMGNDLHYGYYAHGEESLAHATLAMTECLADAVGDLSGQVVLDVGCGTGGPACDLARAYACEVVGISTSEIGIEHARKRSAGARLSERVTFRLGDGMDNGFGDDRFDCVWVMESSHLMHDKKKLLAESARVLKPGGRFVLCDVMLTRQVPFADVIARRADFSLLDQTFGKARMEQLHTYSALAEDAGLVVDQARDLTSETLPTLPAWRDNAITHKSAVIRFIGEEGWRAFTRSCEILEAFWRDGTLGYGLISGTRLAV